MTHEPTVQSREFIAPVTGGVIAPDVRQDIAQAIKTIPNGKKVRITIAAYTKKRSKNQNDYWFAALDKYVVPKFREYGDNWSSWSVHEYVMNELGYQEVLTDPKGRLYVTRKHSKAFNTVQWEEFMERARAYLAQEHGILVKLPNEEMNG